MSHNKSRDKSKNVTRKRTVEESLNGRIVAAYVKYNNHFGDLSGDKRREQAIMEVAKTFSMPLREIRPIIDKMRAEKAGMTVAKLKEYDKSRSVTSR